MQSQSGPPYARSALAWGTSKLLACTVSRPDACTCTETQARRSGACSTCGPDLTPPGVTPGTLAGRGAVIPSRFFVSLWWGEASAAPRGCAGCWSLRLPISSHLCQVAAGRQQRWAAARGDSEVCGIPSARPAVSSCIWVSAQPAAQAQARGLGRVHAAGSVTRRAPSSERAAAGARAWPAAGF